MGKPVQNSFQRYEKKYLMTSGQQAAFLRAMSEYMEPDIYGRTTNCNIYYDNENWDLLRRSIEKPVYKEKLRVRSYGIPEDGDPVFIEIKKKYEGIVYKRRIEMPAESFGPYLAGDSSLSPGSQIGNEIEWFQRVYRARPRVYLAYDRTSYAGKEDPNLRITFDRNIRFRDYDLDLRAGDYGETMLSEDTVLMEIKIPGTAPLWLAQLLSELRIYPTSFSKVGYYYKNYVVNRNKGANSHVRISHLGNNNHRVLPDLHRSVSCTRTA